jgi:hypothetical protein
VHYGEDVRGGLSVIAMVNGVEITDAHWQVASLQHTAAREQSDSLLDRVSESGGSLAQIAAYRELIERTQPVIVIVAAVLMDAALLSEIDRRGLNPTPSEIQHALDASRQLAESVEVSSPGRETDEIGLIVLGALPDRRVLLNAVGADVFEAVLEPALWHLSLGTQALRRDFMTEAPAAGSTPDVQADWREFRLNLVREAQIDFSESFPLPVDGCEPREAVGACPAMETVLQYLQDYFRIVP